jgi:hypothetical protein
MSKLSRGRKREPSGARWKQWKEPEARAALAAWRRSGLSVAAFCAREGYSDTRLRYWVDRLEQPSPTSVPPVSFVPITLSDVRGARQLEIERGGVVLRVREDADASLVARLVAALAAVEPSC